MSQKLLLKAKRCGKVNSMRPFGKKPADLIPASRHLHEDWRILLSVMAFAAGCTFIIATPIPRPSASVIFLTLGLATLPLFFFKQVRHPAMVPLFALVFGAAIAEYRLERLPNQQIERETFVSITGTTERIEYRTDRPARLTISVQTIDKEQWLTDKKIRLTVRTSIPETLKAGQPVSVRAVLSPSPGSIVPGGFDFTVHSRFQGIAAQGFAASAIEIDASQAPDGSFRNYLENRRTNVANRVLEIVAQPLGGIAVALITGQRQYMDPATANVLRDAGLAHLLAISGLHMGLITGVAFYIFELLFAAIPMIALRVTPRKLAAVAAWAFALSYLAMSGASTSTIRAFIMVSIGILAVLTDRRVISLRSIAIAALVILLFSPEAILAIGFQMSFAATIGIVVAYELITDFRRNATRRNATRRDAARQNRPAGRKSVPVKLLLYFGGAAGTSLVAQIAVAPIALYHFQAISLVGILANIIAVPLMAFVVMPAAFLSMVMGLVGLDALFLTLMEQGLNLIVALAQVLGEAPNSVFRAGPYSEWLLIATAGSLGLIMIWRHFSSVVVVMPAMVLCVSASMQKPADVLLDNGGRVIAGKITDNAIGITGGRRGGFRDLAWRRYWNLDQHGTITPLERKCDSRGCATSIALRKEGKTESVPITFVLSQSLETTRKACSEGQIVIASYTHRRHCRKPFLFLASEDIERLGPVGVWIDTDSSTQKIGYRWSNPLKIQR